MKYLLALLVFAAPAAAAPPPGLEARIETLRAAAGIPGMAVTIVEDGQPTFVRGFGVRALGSSAKVDAATIFPTGSTGKAFTTAALAVLVDEGKIGWDDRVIDHLPWFRMYDPWVTREMTIRDLLVHRSGLGLGAGDLLFVPRTSLSRREAVRRLAFIKPATSFRSAYAYDNILYMVAGQLIEEVTGRTWEDFVVDRVMRPAGMTVSTSDGPHRLATADRAYPHARLNGGLRGAGDQERLDERDEVGRNVAGPAGGLAISATDMAHWLQVQLAHGALPGSKRLFSADASTQMWTPVTIEPIAEAVDPFKPLQPTFDAYALGWDVRDYRGTRIVMHTGAVFGFLSAVVMIPGKNIGFAILINSEDGHLIRGLIYELLDHYLGAAPAQWPEKAAAATKARITVALNTLAATAAAAAPVGPSLPLARYAGDYVDPWYGKIEVRANSSGLTIDFKSTPRMSGRLDHFRYDSFVTRFGDRTIEPAYVTFGLDAQGKVDRVTMKPASPLADFSYDYQDLAFVPVATP